MLYADRLASNGNWVLGIPADAVITEIKEPIKVGDVLRTHEDVLDVPNGTVILDKDKDVWQKFPTVWHSPDQNYMRATNYNLFAEGYLPAIVLHLPEES